MNQQAWADLLTSAGAAPYLDGAICRGRHDLFDLEANSDPELIERAQHMCRRCPALNPCKAWVVSLPLKGRPIGVVAAELYGPGGRPQAWEQAA